jgi:hypothetical protein
MSQKRKVMETGTSNLYMLGTNVKRLTGHIKIPLGTVLYIKLKASGKRLKNPS